MLLSPERRLSPILPPRGKVGVSSLSCFRPQKNLERSTKEKKRKEIPQYGKTAQSIFPCLKLFDRTLMGELFSQRDNHRGEDFFLLQCRCCSTKLMFARIVRNLRRLQLFCTVPKYLFYLRNCELHCNIASIKAKLNVFPSLLLSAEQ